MTLRNLSGSRLDRRRRVEELRARLRTDGAALRCWIEILPPRGDIPDGPLSGSAFGIKDCIDIAGRAPSLGTRPSPLREATTDSDIVRALCALGAEPIAATNMDELAIESRGTNRHFGDVKNPRAPGDLAGGSSGGSAAAVAAGLVDFGLGTDFGGSTRIPGARCGLWALKLSAGTATRGVHLIDEEMDAPGLLTRSGSDMSLLCELLGLANGAEAPALFVARRHDTSGADAETLSMLEALAAERSLPALEIPFGSAIEARKHLGGRAFLRWLESLAIEESHLSEAALATKIYGSRLSRQALEAAETARREICETLAVAFGRGCLLCPGPGGDERFMALANLCGLPALCFPCADCTLQIVGPKGSEALLVTAARNLIRD